ncbi:MAG: diguanylate cyclase, partial [Ruminococcus sp.]|nr:diguanylate cyclase [Ruminococcus sp.]
DENMEYNFGFESSLDGWIPRGDISIVPTSEFSYTGKSSLYVSGRKDFWNAPMVRLNNIETGVNYNYSAYVMYNGATYEDSHDFVIKLQYILGGEEVYSEIAGKTLQKGTWSRISGDSIIPAGAEDIFFYIQTADVKDGILSTENDIMSFYIDNVVIFDSTLLIRHRIINCIIIISVSVIILALITFVSLKIIKKTRATKEVLHSVCIDTMTKAYNRNTFEERMKILESSPEKCRKFYFTVCDVNFLKYINDNYGHESGDKAIIRCSEVLLRVIGKKGKVYRTGGDEFICIAKSDFTQDIKTEFLIEASKYKGYPFSVAVGTAHYDKSIDFDIPSIKTILARSDREMYNHKQEIKKFTKEFQHESQ